MDRGDVYASKKNRQQISEKTPTRLVLVFLRTRVGTLGVTEQVVEALVTLYISDPPFCGVVLTGLPKVGLSASRITLFFASSAARAVLSTKRCEASH